MPAWLSALIVWLKSIQPHLIQSLKILGSAWVGAQLQRGKDAGDELEKLDRAHRASARVDLMSGDEVERELRERGLYRDAPEPGSGKLH